MATTTVRARVYGKSKRVIVAGSWGTNGASAVLTVKGEGFTVARTGVGLAEVTFDEIFGDLESFDCKLQLNAAADSVMQNGVYTAPASPTLGKQQVRHMTAGAVAEFPASNANNRVHFVAVLKMGSV